MMKPMLKSSDRPVRLRFAPSPTGFLHIGGVRTALFNWLYAKRHGGQFLLRIEDTDLERSEAKYTDDILASMKWLGLTWDEEPLYQSQRLNIYAAKAEELIEKGFAYRCICTEAQVEKMREAAMASGKRPQYDRTCRDKNLPRPHAGTPYVIRAKIPQEGSVSFDDLIRGCIEFANVDVDDFVLIRSNGAPTYNLSVVVDDVASRMTHIVRGDDHINNTPKQVHLYRFFGYAQPFFAHIPMILGPDKKKLSKRHGAVSANVYRGEGYLPEALLNFLVRLGWSHGDQEVFSVQEMIDTFDFEHVQTSSAVFNVEKLQWVNGVHIRGTPSDRLAKISVEDYGDFFSQEAQLRALSALGAELASFIQQKVKSVRELAEQLVPLCTPGAVEVDPALAKWGKDGSQKQVLKSAITELLQRLEKRELKHVDRTGAERVWGSLPSLRDANLPAAEIEAIFRQISDAHGIKLGDFVAPLRLAVTGRTVSASLFDVLSVLPWDVTCARIQKALTL